MSFTSDGALLALGTVFYGTSGETTSFAGVVAMYRAEFPNASANDTVDAVANTASGRWSLFNLCVSGGVLDAAELFGLNGCP